jgi:hypothetical protein
VEVAEEKWGYLNKVNQPNCHFVPMLNLAKEKEHVNHSVIPCAVPGSKGDDRANNYCGFPLRKVWRMLDNVSTLSDCLKTNLIAIPPRYIGAEKLNIQFQCGHFNVAEISGAVSSLGSSSSTSQKI